jgi:hypothetical protein
LQGSTTIGQCDHKRHSLLQHAVTIDELLLRIIVNLVFWRRNPLGLQQRWRPAAWPITTLCDMQRQQIFARRFEKMARWSSVRLEGQHRRTKKEYLSSMIHVRVRYESRTPADKRGTEARPDDFTISKAFFHQYRASTIAFFFSQSRVQCLLLLLYIPRRFPYTCGYLHYHQATDLAVNSPIATYRTLNCHPHNRTRRHL